LAKISLLKVSMLAFMAMTITLPYGQFPGALGIGPRAPLVGGTSGAGRFSEVFP
jgi:hypothetical protein